MIVDVKGIGQIKIKDDTEMFLVNFLSEKNKEDIEVALNNIIKSGIYFESVKAKTESMMLAGIDSSALSSC